MKLYDKSQIMAALLLMMQALGDYNPIPDGAINVVEFAGAVGDGIVDDTIRVQQALTHCSNNGFVCAIPQHKTLRITRPLYMWGSADLVGVDETSQIYLETGAEPYIINFGISGPQQLQPAWNGKVENVTFRGIGPGSGRILFFWRVDGAQIVNNQFHYGTYSYGAMSSGNNNNIVVNGHINTIRKNITITGNTIDADTTNIGNEGIGLNQWDGATITHNIINGVGDDPIGIHYSKNVQIEYNDLKSVDGRLFVSNSSNVQIRGNTIQRIASSQTGLWYAGISLLYVGHENNSTNGFSAPDTITIENNTLKYPLQSIDNGSAIYVYGGRNIHVHGNTIENDSLTGTITGIHILPFVYTSPAVWTDPFGLDTNNVSRLYSHVITSNHLTGTRPQLIRETGQTCAYYLGPITISNNVAGGYSFICNPTEENNVIQ